MPVVVRALILAIGVLDIPILRTVLRTLSKTPSRQTLAADGQALELVRPAGSGPWPTWVFISGAHPERRREPVVERLTDGLARAGYLVVTADPQGLGEETVTEATLDDAIGAVTAVIGLPDVRGGRVALLGASTGAGLALLVAAEAPLRDRISVVAAAVPYADLRKIICLATTCRYEGSSQVTQLAPSDLLTRVVARSLRTSADPDDATVAKLLANTDYAAFEQLFACLPEAVRRRVSRLSPLNAAPRVQAPVEIVVPPRDEYFPHEEAEALARALPNARLTVTGALDHTRPAARLRSLGSLVRFLGFVLRGLRLSLS